MLAAAKGVSLIEQKRLQWAKEREEMLGLYGLWGRPRNSNENEKIQMNNKNNLLPPIERQKFDEQTKADESETSGYLSDSPKHLNEGEPNQQREHVRESNEKQNNEKAAEQQQYWNDYENNSENYWAEKKMYKNYKNENWAQQSTDSYNQRRFYQTNKNYWHGTPESVSSDDGCRLRWGDRGLGIGHLWEPVVNHPESRLPLVGDPYRQTPKWVEKGLKNADGNQADILIIHHPDDAQYDQPQKNFLLGQNAPIPLEVIEERERKRKKALEHQNAIKRQLEEREMKRKQERENRIREEKLEEERIKKEQEIERLRYEEEQKRIKQKEEIEKKKEEVMKEAIKIAEKRAKEEKILNKRHQINDDQKNHIEFEKKVEKNVEFAERNFNNRREIMKTPRCKKMDDEGDNKRREQTEKNLKDSSSQFEEIQLASNFQLLNMNGMPMDGSVALMLENAPKENFLFPPDGVQLALLMSPRNSTSANRLIPNTPLVSTSVSTGERTLTPSKYRVTERLRFKPSNKATQTEVKYTSAWIKAAKGKKQNRRMGTNSGSSAGSQKCNIDRHHNHFRSFSFAKYRLKQHASKISLEDRPKWGINRPSVQYKKQSEKDPYYQRKIKERLKKAEEMETLAAKKTEEIEDDKKKEMSSVLTLIDCPSDDDEKPEVKDDVILRNGYRMNSNLSSPVFVPIGRTTWETTKKDLDSERSRSNDSELLESPENDDILEDEDVIPGSVGFLTQRQLEAIKQITSLREGLKKLQKDYSHSRSITPLSDKSIER